MQSAKLQAFDYVGGAFSPSPTAWADTQSMLGGQLAISSNQGSSAVMWVCSRTALRAFDPNAEGQMTPLFSSANLPQGQINANGGEPVKMTVPVAANGHVYVGFNNSVLVFGVVGSSR